jgi:hypothetical protein
MSQLTRHIWGFRLSRDMTPRYWTIGSRRFEGTRPLHPQKSQRSDANARLSSARNGSRNCRSVTAYQTALLRAHQQAIHLPQLENRYAIRTRRVRLQNEDVTQTVRKCHCHTTFKYLPQNSCLAVWKHGTERRKHYYYSACHTGRNKALKHMLYY